MCGRMVEIAILNRLLPPFPVCGTFGPSGYMTVAPRWPEEDSHKG